MNELPSATTENYLKTIFELSRSSGRGMAPMGKLAEHLQVTPGTVSVMAQRLAADGLLNYKSRVGCTLTDKGRTIALKTLRRHRVLETFLVEVLDMDWSSVHEEAEKMEHSASDEVIDRMWNWLGRPARDPHGGVIPDDNLAMSSRGADVPISSMDNGTRGTISRLSDRNPGLLVKMRQAGFVPGTPFTLTRQEESGTIRMTNENGELTLAMNVASSLWAFEKVS